MVLSKEKCYLQFFLLFTLTTFDNFLKQSIVGCKIGHKFLLVFGYADDFNPFMSHVIWPKRYVEYL